MSSRAIFRRHRLALGTVLGLFLAVENHSSATQVVTNFTGSVTTPPQVDAISFNNSATWNITTWPSPYRTANTLNYYNSGSMSGSIGWDFGRYPSLSGVGGASAAFTNANNGVIAAVDYPGFGSFLLVNATNIVNKGQLIAGADGKIQLSGVNVSLARSQVQIQPVVSTGGQNNLNVTNFTGDVGIYDQAWGLGSGYFHPHINFVITTPFTNAVVSTNADLSTTTNLLGDITTRAPEIVTGITTPCGGNAGAFNNVYMPYSTDNYLYPSFAAATNNPAGTNLITGFADWTNYVQVGKILNASSNLVTVPTNMIIQVVYVRSADTNVTAQIHFYPSTSSANHAFTAAVLLQTVTNSTSKLASIALVDTMLSQTYSGLYADTAANLVSGCSGTTYRPGNYTLSRTAQIAGQPGLGTPTNDVTWDPSFMNGIMAGINTNIQATYQYGPEGNGLAANWTAYSAYVDNLASEPPAAASPSLTNFPGEVRIYATNLDLTLAKVRAEGELLIQAGNLTPTSTNCTVDCQNLSYNIGSTNGFLHFQNLAHTNAYRLNGTLNVCSVNWNNTITQKLQDGTTNAIPVQLYVMVVDVKSFSDEVPVLVYDLTLHATNILISDQMTVQQNLLLDGTAFTLDGTGSMTLGTYLPTWTYANMPAVRNFTNNGVITVSGNAHFGDDGPSSLAAFVNTGTMSSTGQAISAGYAELDGITEAGLSGELDVYCRTGIVNGVNGGYLDAGANLQFFANNLTISNYAQLYTANTLNFFVTNNLSDGGIGDYNYYHCYDGFNLPFKPASGDLLGTEIASEITGGAEVTHVWAGNDYGSSTAGFLNNAALGQLTLVADDLTQSPLFYFQGAGAHNALYVEYLDLSSLGSDYADYLAVDPSLVIYYYAANGDASLTTPAAANPGLLNGHLVWLGSGQSTNILFGAQSQPYSGAGFKLTVSGEQFPYGLDTLPCVIQGNTNLIQTGNWVDIYTGTPPFNFTAPVFTNRPVQFYRAKL